MGQPARSNVRPLTRHHSAGASSAAKHVVGASAGPILQATTYVILVVTSLRWFSFHPLVTNTSGKEPYYKTVAPLEELEKLCCEGLQVGAKAWQSDEVV